MIPRAEVLLAVSSGAGWHSDAELSIHPRSVPEMSGERARKSHDSAGRGPSRRGDASHGALRCGTGWGPALSSGNEYPPALSSGIERPSRLSGDADIFLYQAYTASPSLRLLPSIVS